MFGGHVLGCSEHHARSGQARTAWGVGGLGGNAEVDDFHHIDPRLLDDKDVGRFEVTVNSIPVG